jgi:hypothetical protein
MDQTRAELISRIEAGDIPLRDLAGLSREDIQLLEHLGRTAYESGRYDKAARIFAGLEELEPDRPEHILRRAYAEAATSDPGIAVFSLTKYLGLEIRFPPDDLARALLLRAELRMKSDPAAARADVRLAQALAEKWPAVKQVIERHGR